MAKNPSLPCYIPESMLCFLQLTTAMSCPWLVLLLFARSTLAVSCYHPDGQAVAFAGYAPCQPLLPGGASMCCATRRADFPDECSPDGLCRNGGDIYRDDCTDSTWKSTGCVHLCTTGFGETGEDVGNPEGQRAPATQTPEFYYTQKLLQNYLRSTWLT